MLPSGKRWGWIARTTSGRTVGGHRGWHDPEFLLELLEFVLGGVRSGAFACRLVFEVLGQPVRDRVQNQGRGTGSVNALFGFLEGAETSAGEVAAGVVVARLLGAHATSGCTELGSEAAFAATEAGGEAESDEGG